jgi:uncharacterized protein YuzE
VKFCHRIGLTYVSCSPFRVPIARLAAAQAAYLRLDDSPIIESEEVSPGVMLDFNEQNQVVGVEMLNLSKRAPGLNLKELQFQTA